ncbi:MAG: undecaprenyl-diphosphate phosphatase [Eubacteriales bacterium]|nr:undecaprenyl-diphosphate phosphatase [Eubacteriales bacterium]
MELNWLESVLFGFLSGFLDIVPVSAQAHKVMMLKFIGVKGDLPLLYLLVDLGVFAALYLNCQGQIVRMNRARALSHVPKKKRRRPLDVRSLMDLSLLRTMLVPVILGLFLYQYTSVWNDNLLWIVIFLFINGIILYVPQFLPSGNRDSRTLSRVEGLLVGLGGAASILPGISAVGAATSVGSVCGIERSYALDMALLMNLFLSVGWIVYDVIALSAGLGMVSFGILVRYLLAAAAAFGGTVLGIRFMRYMAAHHGYAVFAFYCWGIALFTFIFNLMA